MYEASRSSSRTRLAGPGRATSHQARKPIYFPRAHDGARPRVVQVRYQSRCSPRTRSTSTRCTVNPGTRAFFLLDLHARSVDCVFFIQVRRTSACSSWTCGTPRRRRNAALEGRQSLDLLYLADEEKNKTQDTDRRSRESPPAPSPMSCQTAARKRVGREHTRAI